MAADLNELIPEFRNLAETLISNCAARNIEMRPNEGLRSPFVQARYWRRSRTIEEINKKIAELKNKGADFLAHCIESVGPQHGALNTHSIPGFSWHQWGEALDCFWVVNRRAVWDLVTEVNGVNGFMVYASEAKKLGLDAGYYWTSIKDSPHVQLKKTSNPSNIYSLQEINNTMEQRFTQIPVP